MRVMRGRLRFMAESTSRPLRVKSKGHRADCARFGVDSKAREVPAKRRTVDDKRGPQISCLSAYAWRLWGRQLLASALDATLEPRRGFRDDNHTTARRLPGGPRCQHAHRQG